MTVSYLTPITGTSTLSPSDNSLAALHREALFIERSALQNMAQTGRGTTVSTLSWNHWILLTSPMRGHTVLSLACETKISVCVCVVWFPDPSFLPHPICKTRGKEGYGVQTSVCVSVWYRSSGRYAYSTGPTKVPKKSARHKDQNRHRSRL